MNYEELLKKMETEDGFYHHNNYHLVEFKDNRVEVEAIITKNSTNPYGIIHGALIFGLGDVAMGIVARSTGKSAVTLNSNITYLHPGKGKRITATAEMIKDGKKTCYLRAEIYDENKELIATMDGNYYYI